MNSIAIPDRYVAGAAQNEKDICGSLVAKESSDAGAENIVRAGEDRQAGAVDIFLDG